MQRTGVLSRQRTAVSGLVVILTLSACTFAPLQPAPRQVPAPVAVMPAPDGVIGAPDGMADVTASGAEQACIAAGRERGLDVIGVVGSTAATDTNGEPTRDVILRVRSNGAILEPRCNYVPSTRMARIMLI